MTPSLLLFNCQQKVQIETSSKVTWDVTKLGQTGDLNNIAQCFDSLSNNDLLPDAIFTNSAVSQKSWKFYGNVQIKKFFADNCVMDQSALGKNESVLLSAIYLAWVKPVCGSTCISSFFPSSFPFIPPPTFLFILSTGVYLPIWCPLLFFWCLCPLRLNILSVLVRFQRILFCLHVLTISFCFSCI